jgi:hypothetical protein
MNKNLRTPGQVKRHGKKSWSPFKFIGLALIAVMAVGVGIVFSQSGKEKKYVATKEIIYDKATKSLRKPTAEETDALVSQLSVLTNRSSDGLTVNQAADGTKSLNLEGRFGGVVLGRANADGSTEVRCVTTLAEAAEFLGLEEQ